MLRETICLGLPRQPLHRLRDPVEVGHTLALAVFKFLTNPNKVPDDLFGVHCVRPRPSLELLGD